MGIQTPQLDHGTVESSVVVGWKKIELFNSKRWQTCRCRKGAASKWHNSTHRQAWWWVCNVLGCFGGNQVGNLVQIHGIMRKEHYHSILVHHAVPSGMHLFSNGEWVFQEDNDPKRVSILCKKYFKNKIKQQSGKLFKRNGPPQSPDLSPIELLWEETDRAVLKKKPTSVTELVRVVHEAWDELQDNNGKVACSHATHLPNCHWCWRWLLWRKTWLLWSHAQQTKGVQLKILFE